MRGADLTALVPSETIIGTERLRARRDHFMTRLAMWEAAEDGRETDWGDQVTDDQYLG